MFQFIQKQIDLSPVLALMDQHVVYGLDTEFIKVDTLWPKLGVFQINVADHIYLLDGTTLDLSEFWHKLFNAKQNVFHACGEDIDLIYHYAQHKYLENVFDTQVAMSFLGYGLQMSYQNALKTVLNVDIEKDQTRSDWLARPLSEKQLNYAANDVVYLNQLAKVLQAQLQRQGLLDWVLEDCRHLTYEIGQQTAHESLYQDVGTYRHSRRQLMQVQQLALWREKLVHELDLPRSFILKNQVIHELVEHNPRNHSQLSLIKGLRPNILREYGSVIIRLLKNLPEAEQWPKRLARPIRQPVGEIGQQIEQLLDHVSQETTIPKEVLLRKKWMNALYQNVAHSEDHQQLPKYLLGWRYELLTQPLCKILQSDKPRLIMQMHTSGE